MPSAHGSRHPAEAASAWIHRRSCGRSIVDLCGGVLVDTPDRAPVLSGSSIAGSAVGPGLGRGQAAAGRGSCRAWWNSSFQAGFPGPVRGTCSSCRCFEPPRPRYPTRRRALPANKYRPGGIPLAGGSALLHMTFPQVAPGPILMVPRQGLRPEHRRRFEPSQGGGRFRRISRSKARPPPLAHGERGRGWRGRADAPKHPCQFLRLLLLQDLPTDGVIVYGRRTCHC
jgi:hypothetical protein